MAIAQPTNSRKRTLHTIISHDFSTTAVKSTMEGGIIYTMYLVITEAPWNHREKHHGIGTKAWKNHGSPHRTVLHNTSFLRRRSWKLPWNFMDAVLASTKFHLHTLEVDGGFHGSRWKLVETYGSRWKLAWNYMEARGYTWKYMEA